MTRPVPVALHHTCFVVRDLEAAARALSDSLGIGPWNVFTIEPERSTVRGVERQFSFRVALTEVGGGTYELITPHSGRSVYDEHLEQYGNGFHHTCMVYPTMEAVREAKAALLGDGRTMLQEWSGGDVFDFAYFEFPEIGSPIELLFLDPEQLPPPDAVI
ncbi:MAG: VOC family protein [Gemmatimonadetes bacterium]|nr:VOC family protein [Gemmatimonadota bacterium]